LNIFRGVHLCLNIDKVLLIDYRRN